MTYHCELAPGLKIYFDNQDQATTVTLSNQQPSQQQQTCSSITTGTWVSPPEVFQVESQVVVKIYASQGTYCLQIQGNHIDLLGQAPDLSRASKFQVQTTSMQPTVSSPSMQPMQPLRMGEMHMTLAPMEMRMGNLEMRMGAPGTNTQTNTQTKPQASRSFCSQCGTAVKSTDRFCSSCGIALS